MLPYIAEPQELASALPDSRLLLLDLSREETWIREHLPGAVHVHPAELVCGVKPATGKLPGAEQLAALATRIGLSPEHHVVAYDDEGGGWAGRMLWTLDVMGHAAHSLLNGGLVAWRDEGLPLSPHVNTSNVSDTVVEVTLDRSPIIDKAELASRLDDPTLRIWDARSPEEFAGVRQHAARAGHIPGAINLDWHETMDPGRGLRIRADIRERLAALGITEEFEVVTHCQTHHRSGLTYVVGKSLGLRIRAYDGSWSEWGNDPRLPIE